ncbi:hypothetical protein CBM2585_A60228 [Cupriavidus taiwanensis]|nr:hypothetical protein CBM2585_A60228 [Cupriavidus taiwanensis]
MRRSGNVGSRIAAGLAEVVPRQLARPASTDAASQRFSSLNAETEHDLHVFRSCPHQVQAYVYHAARRQTHRGRDAHSGEASRGKQGACSAA